jgi:hypothetical protein
VRDFFDFKDLVHCINFPYHKGVFGRGKIINQNMKLYRERLKHQSAILSEDEKELYESELRYYGRDFNFGRSTQTIINYVQGRGILFTFKDFEREVYEDFYSWIHA